MKSCNVVTIAFTDGTPAVQIGLLAARQLGFRYINDAVIDQAAAKAGIKAADLEKVEHTRSLAERLAAAIAGLSPINTANLVGEAEWQMGFFNEFALSSPTRQVPTSLLPVSYSRDDRYRDLIKDALWETADRGKAVIGAHGASIGLAGRHDVLRVFVTGSPEVRAQRLADSTTELSEKEARRRIDHGDHERAAYLNRFYDVKQELPTHYDLVLNTDVVPAAAAAEAIACTARLMG